MSLIVTPGKEVCVCGHGNGHSLIASGMPNSRYQSLQYMTQPVQNKILLVDDFSDSS